MCAAVTRIRLASSTHVARPRAAPAAQRATPAGEALVRVNRLGAGPQQNELATFRKEARRSTAPALSRRVVAQGNPQATSQVIYREVLWSRHRDGRLNWPGGSRGATYCNAKTAYPKMRSRMAKLISPVIQRGVAGCATVRPLCVP